MQGKKRRGNTPERVSVPFQIREARAFPLQTLVLAFSARSRHMGQVFPRPDVVGTYLSIIESKRERRTLNVFPARTDEFPWANSDLRAET